MNQRSGVAGSAGGIRLIVLQMIENSDRRSEFSTLSAYPVDSGITVLPITDVVHLRTRIAAL